MHPLYPAIALIINSLFASFSIPMDIQAEELQATVQTLVAIFSGLWLLAALLTKKRSRD